MGFSHITSATSASDMTLLVTPGPDIQSLEPDEFRIIHGEHFLPLDSCEYLLDFNKEEHGSIKWCLVFFFFLKLYRWTWKHL